MLGNACSLQSAVYLQVDVRDGLGRGVWGFSLPYPRLLVENQAMLPCIWLAQNHHTFRLLSFLQESPLLYFFIEHDV